MSYCCKCDKEGIKDNLAKLLVACKNNEKFLRAYMLDFFVNKHWDSLPKKWTDALGKLSPEELGHWILYPEPYKYRNVWPLSLIALRSAVQFHSLERQPKSDNWRDPPLGFSKNCSHRDFLNFNLQVELNRKLYSKHIKPKKFHEIEVMAQVTANCATRLGCKYVVDIGSGLGHLGRILAFHYGLRVCCLEEQSCLTEKAKKIDEQLLKSFQKTGKQFLVPVHINKSINIALNQNELMQILLKAFNLQTDDELKFGLVGLHPCGDLGPTLMRLLVDSPNAIFINVVGCCYMKLTDESPGKIQGYPMSGYVNQNIVSRNLSYEAREVSCHALEMYCDRLKKGGVEDLKIHCYRSTLECILVKHWPHLKHSGLKSIKHVQNLDFAKYAVEAVKKLNISLPTDELEAQEIKTCLSQWKNVVVFYSLRLLLAPLVESAILLDRLLYMSEQGMTTMLIPAFDPQFSPRNHILVAFKGIKR